jgi:hypothetical protein
MLGRFTRLAGLTVVAGLLAVPAAHAGPRISIQIGAPGPVYVAPAPVYVAPPHGGYVWQPGYYVRSWHGRSWVPGRWVPRAHVYREWRRDRWEGERWRRDRYGASYGRRD